MRTERREDVLIITLDRAERRNALDPETISRLGEVLSTSFETDPPQALVVAAEGRTFSAGVDMEVFASYIAGDVASIEAVIDGLAGVMAQVSRLPCLTVAAVQGVAAGPGMALALACDLRVVGKSARLVPGFFRFGGSPDGGVSAMLVRAFGPTRALAMCITDTPVAAEALVQLGIAEALVPDEGLLDAAMELSTKFKGRPADSWPRLRSVLAAAAQNDLLSQLDLERSEAKKLIADVGFRDSLTSHLKP